MQGRPAPPTPPQRTLGPPHQVKFRAAGAPEIAHLRVVDAEPVVDIVDEFWNEEIQIGIALTMGMRRHVERHAFDAGLEIGAVVEIEAADKVLVRLAAAASAGSR